MVTPLPVRVLFVEDSADDVQLLLRTLRAGGFDVDWVQVDEADAFIAALDAGPWDVILCDYAMGRFDPSAALRLLQDRGLDIPLLVVSGNVSESIAVGLMKAGARDYVNKDNLARLVPAITRELRDAIARKEGREAHSVMRQSEAFFRTVVEHSSDVIAVTDLDARILHIAPSVEHVLGRSAEELVGTNFLDLIVPDDRPRSDEKLRALSKGPGLNIVSEVGFLRPDGTVRVLECAATSFRMPSGGDAIAINARDVTARRRQEHSLRETGARLALLNAVARAAHFGASAPMIIRRTLDALAASFPGKHAVYCVIDENNFLVVQETAGPPDGVQPEGRSINLSLLPDVLSALEQGRVFTVDDVAADERVRAVEGEARAMHVRATALAPLSDLGQLKGGLSLASLDPHVWTEHEVTTLAEVAVYLSLALNEEAAQRERRQAQSALQQSEAQLRQAQKMEAIGRLAGGIAHDFNNLLTAILGYGELVVEQIGEHPAARDVEQILDAGRRAATLTRQLLAFSRQQTLAPVILCPNDVVTDMAQLIGRLLGHEVNLQIDLQTDLGNIKVDRGQLEQVLMNLAVNARDAMPEGGRLRIATRSIVLDAAAALAASIAPGRHVMLEVSDSGTGMEPDTMARIFEPFFTTKEKGAGTGLGLSTVYGIVSQSGGGVEVESTPGMGTAFKLYFPETSESEESSEAPPASTPLVILILEPDSALRTEARKLLARAGHTLLEANALDKAVALADRNAVDVLLVGAAAEPSIGALRDALSARRPGLRVAVLPPLPFRTRTLLGRIEGAEPSAG